MARLTMPDVGRAALAGAVKSRTILLAVGSGDVAWGASPPDPDAAVTALVAPLALVRSSIKEFAVPDPAGLIEVADGSRWSISATPTKYVYISFVLGYADGADATLREMAVYLDPVLAQGVPIGQSYVPWASVTDPGQLFALKRFAPKERAGVRQTFGEILTL